MKKIIECVDGFRWVDGDTESIQFGVDSDTYSRLVSEGCEVVRLPEADKIKHRLSQSIEAITTEVDRIINEAATSRGYRHIDSIGKFQGRNGPFSAQCDAMGEWVDACYLEAFRLEAAIKAGDALLPAIEEVAGQLPEFIDPGVTV